MLNVVGVLNALQIKVDHVETKRDGTVEYYARCPHHYDGKKVDHSPSWSIEDVTGNHHCFSCGFTGSALYLAFKVLDLSWDDAVAWIEKHNNSLATVLEMDPWDASRPALTQRLPINEARLASYDVPPSAALTGRSLTVEACDRYGVRWDHKSLAWITPIRDPESFELWGWQMKGAESGSRLFRNLPFGVQKSETLFGVDVVGAPNAEVWVVESPLDAVRLASLGYEAVSTYGAKVSKVQCELMLAKYDALVIAMDNDDAGRKAALGFLDYARRIPMRFFNYGDSEAKDVGDMTPEEISFGHENARHALWGRKALGL